MARLLELLRVARGWLRSMESHAHPRHLACGEDDEGGKKMFRGYFVHH